MKTITRKLLIAGVAGAALVSGSLAIARSPGCDGPAGGDGMGRGPAMSEHGHGHGHGHWQGKGGPGRAAFNPEEMAKRHLDRLEGALALTAEQTPAWKAYASAVEKQAARMAELRKARGDAPRTLPERIDRAQEVAKAREAGLAEVGPAAKALYETLTPEQREVMDRKGHRMHG